jgi:hypothetical protein
VARVLPENAWLTSLTGTTSSSVSLDGGGASSLRGALPVPAIQIVGCTTSQASVAKMMARMRLIDGVQRVSLEDSAKGDAVQAAAGTTDSAGGGDCRGGSGRFPKFNLVVFFQSGSPAATAGTQTAAATTGSTPVTASSTTPASSSTPSTTTTPATPSASGGTTP